MSGVASNARAKRRTSAPWRLGERRFEAIAAHKAELERSRQSLEDLVSSAQAAEAELIAEIEEAREALGDED